MPSCDFYLITPHTKNSLLFHHKPLVNSLVGFSFLLENFRHQFRNFAKKFLNGKASYKTLLRFEMWKNTNTYTCHEKTEEVKGHGEERKRENEEKKI